MYTNNELVNILLGKSIELQNKINNIIIEGILKKNANEDNAKLLDNLCDSLRYILDNLENIIKAHIKYPKNIQVDNEQVVNIQSAVIKNAIIDTFHGITFKELKEKKEMSKKVFYDKWGTCWQYQQNNGCLYFTDVHILTNEIDQVEIDWHLANMDAPEIEVMKFFTAEEFEKIKPEYLKNKPFSFNLGDYKIIDKDE